VCGASRDAVEGVAARILADDAEVPPEHQRGILSMLEKSAIVQNEPGSDATIRVEKLSAGFCNWVYRCDVEGGATRLARAGAGGRSSFVVKLFSKLAKLRVNPLHSAAVDEVASHLGIAADLFYKSDDGLCHEMLPGLTLTEDDIHGGDGALALRVAEPLAKLHSAAIPEAFRRDASYAGHSILVLTMRKMLRHVDAMAHQGRALPKGIVLDDLEKAVDHAEACLEGLGLPLVLGHGDLKPSNIVADGAGAIKFIDFELAGPNYRGFDLFKLFRTSRAEGFDPKLLRAFLGEYLLAGGGGAAAAVAQEEKDALVTEVLMFEPVTWLEAGLFFVFANTETRDARWEDLARHRWDNYRRTRHVLEEKCDALRKHKKR